MTTKPPIQAVLNILDDRGATATQVIIRKDGTVTHTGDPSLAVDAIAALTLPAPANRPLHFISRLVAAIA